MKKFAGEFKEFISRGNVVDMAIGVVVGGAFKGIVDSLVNDIIMPVVGWLLGGLDFSSYAIKLSETIAEDGTPVIESAIWYGKFINSIISFLIIAFCLFLVVKLINNFRRKEEKAPDAPAPVPEPSAEEKLLSEIRDLLKENTRV